MNTINNRDIRVFISSTFSDMQSERDFLIKKVFQRLQVEASKRNVSITPLDLRWGITEDETKSGKVLQVCLQEIENSHPFFIGLVGNRYGWCPTKEELDKNEVLYERWGEWLEKDIAEGMSVTEIEMQYGVLRSKEELDAFFYIKEGGVDEKDNADKLERLRNTIRNNGRCPVEEYDSLESLGAKVEKAFIELLDKRFPIGNISEYNKERYANDAFLQSRIQSYIAKGDNVKAIDDFINNPEQHYLVISGDSGSGKSSLIANWIQNNPENKFHVIYHFVGNGINTSNHSHILDFLYEEICNLYDLQPIPDESLKRGTKESIDNLLNQIANKKELLIIVDGINQIVDVDNAKLLNWLPYSHKNVKWLFSTTPNDTTYEAFTYRKFPFFNLVPLDSQDRRMYIRNYLEKYGRHLTDRQVELIANDQQNENMLVLRTMLDELLCFGIHEQLEERIEYYLKPNSIESFFQQVLERYEMDFPNGFVENVLSLIAFSRSGLQEREIIDMTSANQLQWSQLYCAFRNNLIISGGFITFSHRYIADAVKKRYVKNEDECRKTIIRYFGGDKTNRSKYELPYQLIKLKLYDVLYSLLLIPDVFQYHLFLDRRELAKYWRVLRHENPNKYRLSAYLDKTHDYNLSDYFKTPEELSDYYYTLGYFIGEFFSDYDLVIDCYNHSLSVTDNADSMENATIYNNVGHICSLMGHYDQALEMHQKALSIRSKLLAPDHILSAQSYGNMGFIYDKLGQYGNALELFHKSLDIHKKQCGGVDDVFVANDYNNIGHVLTNQGRLLEGLEYEKKALSIRQMLLGDNNFDTAMSYHNIGAVLFLLDNQQEAYPYLQKASDIWVSILGEKHPQVATGWYDLGCFFRQTGRYDDALLFFEKALNVRMESISETHPDTINNYNTLADFCFQLQNYEKSKMYYSELNRILSNDPKHLDPDFSRQIVVLGGIGMANCMLGEYDEGVLYLTQAISICETYSPNNQQLLIGLKSNLLSMQLRKKQGFKPNEVPKVTININQTTESTDTPNQTERSKPTKESLIKRIIKFLIG